MTNNIKAKIISTGIANGILTLVEKHNDYNEKVPLIYIIEDLSVDSVIEILYMGNLHGVISKSGNLTSHGASLLREKLIPTVVISPEINIRLFINKHVKLNDPLGEITILD